MKTISRFFLTLLMAWLTIPSGAQSMADFNVVPLPRQCMAQKGKPLKVDDIVAIRVDGGRYAEDMHRNAQMMVEYLCDITGKRIEVTGEKRRGCLLTLRINDKMTEPEGYRITVSEKGICIEGQAPQGVFYGIQTLRKALNVDRSGGVMIAPVVVDDAPRFAYRGMHLDVSRHFFGVDFVKQYLDMLALHHINTFHFHLTDDQGWRVEIKKYPRLQSEGAYRNRTVVGRNVGIYENRRYGGYFTQEEIRDIVKYARERYITVIPEIDMPGHMEAALTAYPELGCTKGPYEVEANWGVFDDILCAGREETFAFVEGVLDEIMDLFPSTYIHIGGDEAPRTRWKACADCQRRIREEGLTTAGKRTAEDLLQGYFMKRVEKYLNSKGRKAIGWDELLDCNVNASTTIMSWRGQEGGLAASEKGHDVIMVPTGWFYFDYYQIPEDTWNKPLLIGGYVPLEKVYSFEPAPDSLPAAAREHIIGLQANLWTEYVYTEEFAEYQVLPRMGALSEVQWMMPEKKNYADYKQRQQRLNHLYQEMGWQYCDYEWKKK